MPTWIFNHIAPVPDLMISWRKDYKDFRVTLIPHEENFHIKQGSIFQLDEATEFIKKFNSKNGVKIDLDSNLTINIRYKSFSLKKKLIIESEGIEYSGLKI